MNVEDEMEVDDFIPPPESCEPHEVLGSRIISKATLDCWTYLVVLRNGISIVCSDMTKRGEFIELSGIDTVTWPDGRDVANGRIFFGRGAEVRLDHISMIVDQDS